MSKDAERFREWFETATGFVPYPYQERLALDQDFPGLLDVHTGLGKTEGVFLAWVWRRKEAGEEVKKMTPRRLVYCLPMRVLVEQTAERIRKMLSNLGLLAGSDGHSRAEPVVVNRMAVTVLLGGEDEDEWYLWPHRDAVLVGTQDMLLSRALNRGYAMNHYRWPIQFGLLNNDCMWVMDEVQLMGSGLVTTCQLDAFRAGLWQPLLPCRSIWMSATLGGNVLHTRDRRDLKTPEPARFSLKDSTLDLQSGAISQRLAAAKTVSLLNNRPEAWNGRHTGITDLHSAGRISLIVLNTVKAAQDFYRELKQALDEMRCRDETDREPVLVLLHGRLRPRERGERLRCLQDFLSRQDKATASVADHPGLVVVATQVIEAGFDLSAARLWSEIAPWASVVQRLGRLNREGKQPDATATFWMPESDPERDESSPNYKRIGPYDREDLKVAYHLISDVTSMLKQGMRYRDAMDSVCATKKAQEALDMEAESVIRPDDVYGLFSTEPDLAGGFTDISLYVRDQDREPDVHVFWRDIPRRKHPADHEPGPVRDEVVAVPFYSVCNFLGTSGYAWEWNFETSRWDRRHAGEIFPGMTIMLARSCGGYSEELGWTGKECDQPPPVVAARVGQPFANGCAVSDGLYREIYSETEWGTLQEHLEDTHSETSETLREIGVLDPKLRTALITAARWHDWGKSLARWQAAITKYLDDLGHQVRLIREDAQFATMYSVLSRISMKLVPPRTGPELWAKFPDVRRVWGDPTIGSEGRDEAKNLLTARFRPRLRHEAASALGAWKAWRQGQPGLTALAVYLIGSHHGKVRTVLRSTQDTDEVFGLTPEDCLQPVPGHIDSNTSLTFTPKLVGAAGSWNGETDFRVESESWIAMVSELLGGPDPLTPAQHLAIPDGEPRDLGPFKLAFLEALLCAADMRASKWPRRERASDS
ncbi:MAG: DEAD/DEAH box helicase [Acidobacteriota bacterium]